MLSMIVLAMSDGLHSFDTTISNCLDLSSRFSSFHCSFVRRLSNCLVHALAHILLFDFHVMNEVLPPANLVHSI